MAPNLWRTKVLLSVVAVLFAACSGTTSDGASQVATATPEASLAGAALSASPGLQALSPAPSTAGVGLRISLAVGIALRLPSGWTQTEKLDEIQLMSGVVFGATGPDDQALALAVVPYSEPKAFRDAFSEQVAASGASVGSATTVDLPAGSAARLVVSTTNGKVAMVAIGDGQAIDNCRAIPAGYVLTLGSTTGGAPDEVALDEIADSLELDMSVAECGAPGGPAWSTPAITWSSGSRFGKYGDSLYVLMARPGGQFLALGKSCQQATPEGGTCPGVTRNVAWLGSSVGPWREVTFPEAEATYDMAAGQFPDGVVAVQTSAVGGAIVWSSSDGRSWVKRSVIGGEPGCTDLAGSPYVTGVQTAESSYYVTGNRCEAGEEVATIYRSSDLRSWTVVDRIPIEGPSETAVTGLPEYAETPVKIDDWYVSFEADAGEIESWGWLSPDGAHWRELAFPPDVGVIARIAGRDGTVMVVSDAAGWEGFESRIATIN